MGGGGREEITKSTEKLPYSKSIISGDIFNLLCHET